MANNRQGIAFLLVSLLILDAVSAQLVGASKPSFRGQDKILVMDQAAPAADKTPTQHQAIIDNKGLGAKKGKKVSITAGVAGGKKCAASTGGYGNGSNNDGCQNSCHDSRPKFPKFHDTYSLKYETLGCTLRTIDQIVSQCVTVDTIEQKSGCINNVVTIPVKVQKVNELHTKIKVVKPVHQQIHVLRTVQKPVDTLVTECVTVYEVVTQSACINSLNCYTTNERQLVHSKVNIRYVVPKQTDIRVVKSEKKEMRVLKTACEKYSASISQKPCTKWTAPCTNVPKPCTNVPKPCTNVPPQYTNMNYQNNNGGGMNNENGYQPNMGNQYGAKKAVEPNLPAGAKIVKKRA